jgi:hypothetical protein
MLQQHFNKFVTVVFFAREVAPAILGFYMMACCIYNIIQYFLAPNPDCCVFRLV